MMRADAAAAVACLRYTPRVTGMEQESGDGEGGGSGGRKGETERRKAGITARVCA